MLSIVNNIVVFDYEYCQQCGTCLSVCPRQAISSIMRVDGTSDIFVNVDACVRCKKCVDSCPANSVSEMSSCFSVLINRKYGLSHNKDEIIRRNSSSGGATKTIIIDALQNGIVDGVYTLKKTDSFPFAEGEFFTKENPPTFESMPNSVYHSVMLNSNIHKVQSCKRLLIVGTSCQLKGMKKALRGRCEELLSICIFCKQQKTVDSTAFLCKESKFGKYNKSDVFPQYRGNGWPGVINLNSAHNKTELQYETAAQLPFGRRLWTVKGCNVCGDPFGIETQSDITVMDPWKIHKQNELGDTLITIHTNNGRLLIEKSPNLETCNVSYDEVKPALGEVDIKRKMLLVPFFRGQKVPFKIKVAGRLEKFQRSFLEKLLNILPALPIVAYKVINRLFPDLRNIILK